MWFTPASTASLRTATASEMFWGGPQTCGPASCIAPYPMRLSVIAVPGSVNVPAALICDVIVRPSVIVHRQPCLARSSRMGDYHERAGAAEDAFELGDKLTGNGEENLRSVR